MAKQEKISIREFAKRIHVSDGAVRKAIETGKIKKGVVYDIKIAKGKEVRVPSIIFSVAYQEYGVIATAPKAGHGISKQRVADKLDKANTSNGATGDDDTDDEENEGFEDLSYEDLIKKLKINASLPYKEALRKNEILRIAENKMKLEELRGALVRKADVEKSLFSLGADLKTKLQNIPNRCISMIRGATTDVEATNILTLEINQVLEEFANKI